MKFASLLAVALAAPATSFNLFAPKTFTTPRRLDVHTPSSLDAFSLKKLFKVGGSNTATASTAVADSSVGSGGSADLSAAYGAGDKFMDVQLQEVSDRYVVQLRGFLNLFLYFCYSCFGRPRLMHMSGISTPASSQHASNMHRQLRPIIH